MMKINYKSIAGVLLGVMIFLPINYSQADELGRLFLTSKERARLEKMRYAKPEPVVEEVISEPVEITELNPGEFELPEIDLVEEPVLTEPLLLKGVVKRSNGKNAAWLNDGNTLDSDSVLQNIEIHNSDIDHDSVKIKLPDKVTEITLKVGQTYEPTSVQKRNIDEN